RPLFLAEGEAASFLSYTRRQTGTMECILQPLWVQRQPPRLRVRLGRSGATHLQCCLFAAITWPTILITGWILDREFPIHRRFLESTGSARMRTGDLYGPDTGRICACCTGLLTVPMVVL